MIHGILAFKAPPVSMGPVISAQNLLTDGSLSSLGPVGNWYNGFYADKANDGVLLTEGNVVATRIAYTYSSGSTYNNGVGITMTFTTPKRVGRFKISAFGTLGFGGLFNYTIEAKIGGIWTQVAKLPAPELSFELATFDFNVDGAIVATEWRWFLSDVVSSVNNYYVGEVEAYEVIL